MAPGAPRGKRKVARGGGKKFSRDLRPLDAEDDGAELRNKPEGDDDDGDGDEDDDDDEGSEDGSEDGGRQQQSMTREERKAAVKAKKEAAKARLATAESDDDDDDDDDDDEEEVKKERKDRPARGITVVNPNDDSGSLPSTGLSRREREAAEAAAAKERYWKLQQAGKTDQARADMARLAVIRQEREEKARQRKAELDEKKALAEAKAAARTGKR